MCVCVCVCLQINHNDVVWLGLKADQARDGDLVYRGSILGKLDLEMGRVDEDTDGEKDGDHIEDKQLVCLVFGSQFVLSHEKPFGVVKLVQCVLCDGGSSQIISFITFIELEQETGRILLMAMVVTALVALLVVLYLEWQNGQESIE